MSLYFNGQRFQKHLNEVRVGERSPLSEGSVDFFTPAVLVHAFLYPHYWTSTGIFAQFLDRFPEHIVYNSKLKVNYYCWLVLLTSPWAAVIIIQHNIIFYYNYNCFGPYSGSHAFTVYYILSSSQSLSSFNIYFLMSFHREMLVISLSMFTQRATNKLH